MSESQTEPVSTLVFTLSKDFKSNGEISETTVYDDDFRKGLSKCSQPTSPTQNQKKIKSSTVLQITEVKKKSIDFLKSKVDMNILARNLKHQRSG